MESEIFITKLRIARFGGIAQKYYNFKEYLDDVKNNENLEIDKEYFKQAKDYISKVDKTLKRLKPKYRIFIRNDFLYEKDRNWWYTVYSRASYYRNRKQALIHFFRVYDNE